MTYMYNIIMKRLCLACTTELVEAKLTEGLNVLVCTNQKCKRVGLLTVLYATITEKKEEKNGKKDKKS